MLTARPNAEGAYRQLAAKTPGRALSRNENAHRGAPATVHGKGKNVLLQTPFNPTTKLLPNDTDKPQPLEYLRQLRPLEDKTPFHNRSKQEFQTPFALCFDDVQTPDSLLRPSSLRRHVRAPRMSLSPSVVKTPHNTIHPWECDVSVEAPEVAAAPVVPVDDHDEIEYMAPNTLDLEYSPPFDFELPDYKKVGMRLRSLVHASYDDEPPPPDPVLSEQDDLAMVSWEGLLELPELESSDPFVVMSKAMKAQSSTRPTGRATAFPSTSRPPVRARSALATTKSTTLSRATSRSTTTSGAARPVKAPLSKAPRPATAMSNTTTSSRAPRPTTALSAAGSSRAPISRRPVVPKTLKPSKSMNLRVRRPAVEKKDSEQGLALNVEKSTLEDFIFDV